MLRLENVQKVYRTDTIETLALSRINLEVKAGEIVSIMGPSGSGKSTLLNLMGLLDEPTSGTIVLNGKAILSFKDADLARLRNKEIGFIFQTFHLVSDLNAMDNVEIPLLYRKMNAADRRKRCQAALERVGLSSRMKHFPSQMSGGQQQRVAIARAIVGNPALLLADEPTGNLDSQMSQDILAILKELNQEGTTIVMVTYDAKMAQETHRTIRIFDGRMVAETEHIGASA
jgi:putative ABC transport system ATP-binding protein